MEEIIIALFEDADKVVHVLKFEFACPECSIPVWTEMDENGSTQYGPIWKGFPLSFSVMLDRPELFITNPPYIFIPAEQANYHRRLAHAEMN